LNQVNQEYLRHQRSIFEGGDAMQRTWSILGSLIGLALLGGARRVYRARTRERVPGNESMDSPEVAAGFNRVAGWPQMRLLRWYVAQRALRLARRGTAVDLGCGPGHLLFELAQRAPALRLTGVDLSDEVLAQAEAAARRQGYAGRVAFKKGGAQAIPFPDGSLDLVISTLSLHHWRQPVAVLDEAARALRPGGAFLIFDLRRDMAAPFYLLIWFATRCVVPRALRRVSEPLGSRNAAYTPPEAAALAAHSRLSGWRVSAGPLWLIIEGQTAVNPA
jgi:ubiquinone/menaquinone biosynthesis C-methylase UbiE